MGRLIETRDALGYVVIQKYDLLNRVTEYINQNCAVVVSSKTWNIDGRNSRLSSAQQQLAGKACSKTLTVIERH